jgi:hypothetical protein
VQALLVDSPAASASEQPSAADRQSDGSAGPPESGSAGERAPQRACNNCDAPLRAGQEWCLQCGAAQPGSLDGERPNWRPLSTLTLVAVLLSAAAVAAGAAALSSHKAAAPRTLTVAQAPLPTTSTPTASTPTTPTTPGTAQTVPLPKAPKSTGANNPLFPSTGSPPKIPSTTSTPKSSSGAGTGTSPGAGESTGTTTTGATEKSSTGSNPGSSEAEQPSALLLDTDAASTYNPYSYPEVGFGDPGLAIDGEPTTAWTAQVQPSSAPNMAEGLVLDLKTPTKLGAVRLITQTPGMTVQLYGATAHKPPATITEPGWDPLSSTHVLKKKSTRLKLHVTKAFRYVVVWIVKAPASAVGTVQAPGRVDLNEVELFPRAS